MISGKPVSSLTSRTGTLAAMHSPSVTLARVLQDVGAEDGERVSTGRG
jgi:hypothetical protein